MHSVLPEEVKANAEKLTPEQMLERIEALPAGPEWVTLSGGNPAIHDLSLLVELLQRRGYRVSVETQGSVWKAWLGRVNCLTISPKPPSSGMADKTAEHLGDFLTRASLVRIPRSRDALKIVSFNDADTDWAIKVFQTYPTWPRYLSCGTDSQGGEPLEDTAERYRKLCERASHDIRLQGVRVLPQLHVIAWAHARGV
jgi:7-carboxy-7-deazaguanine synthase